jgi:hypothetical protein
MRTAMRIDQVDPAAAETLEGVDLRRMTWTSSSAV